MTLAQAKAKAKKVMDEYSISGELSDDEDILLKMNSFFDTAQKTLANIKRIRRRYPVPRQEGVEEYPMPEDFNQLYRVYRDGEPCSRLGWRGDSLVIPEQDRAGYEVEYFANPADIQIFETESAESRAYDQSYEFEIAPDAQECMPFFVAAQVFLTDFVQDYRDPLAVYDRMVATLSSGVATQPVKLKNTLWG